MLSGVNFGQNMGSTVDISGTSAPRRAAAQRGIPALAVSAGLAEKPAYAIGARQAVAWLTENRAELGSGATATVTNLNMPTCPTGTPRKLVVVPVAGDDENPIADVNCTGTGAGADHRRGQLPQRLHRPRPTTCRSGPPRSTGGGIRGQRLPLTARFPPCFDA